VEPGVRKNKRKASPGGAIQKIKSIKNSRIEARDCKSRAAEQLPKTKKTVQAFAYTVFLWIDTRS
jgi:hypothetical protein